MPRAGAEVGAVDQREVGESVTRSWHSVWARSRASSSPRWVGLAPTTTAPGQGGRLEPEDELGHVVEEDGHVERARARGAGSQAARGRARRPPRRGSGAGPRPRGRARRRRPGEPAPASRRGLRGPSGPPVVRQLGSPHLRTSLTWDGTPNTGTRCTLDRPVLPSPEPGGSDRGTVERSAAPWSSGSSTPSACCPGTARSTGRRPSTTASWTSWPSSWRPTRPGSSTPGPPSTTS